MKEAISKCVQCGAQLDESGCCSVCKTDQTQLTAANISSFVDRIKHLLVLPRMHGPRQSLGELSLINKQTSESYCLNNRIIKIGRDSTNEIALASDTAISRNHACIMFLQDSFWLEDLDSTNGTLLNGRKVKSRKQLFLGDHIAVGKTQLVVTLTDDSVNGMRDYEIIEEIGRGGMAIVYKAHDHQGNRTVALKQLTLHNLAPARSKARSERFRREASIALRLNHPNIVPVYDVHLGPDNFYYVMELLTGRNLRIEIAARGGKLSARNYLPILEQVAAALGYAHSRNVVHRDVKPDNIFIMPDGSVKLTDFGIARVIEDLEEANLTKSGAMLGTLAYSAPEQLDNARRVDHKADIFSLGVVTYEALSGISPFQGDGITDTVVQIASTQAKPLNELVDDISPRLAAVVAKALAKKAQERWRSVSEFAQQFREALSER